MRSFVDFDYITLAITPLFVFSGTFFPLERYPAVLETVVRWSPLYQGVALSRAAVLGDLHIGLLWHVVYLVAMGVIGTTVASRRLSKLLKP
jgi:lipooligosaccharide transport system permease protein